MTELKLIDMAKDSFQMGVTNFTMDNLFDALGELELVKDVSLQMHPAVFNRCRKCDMLDRHGDDQYSLQGMSIYPTGETRAGNVYDTVILHKGSPVGTLRTREA